MIDKLPAMYLFTNDYITGTRTLSLTERGIYIDLLCFSQSSHGKGLSTDVKELAKMVLPFELDVNKNEEHMASLIKVLNTKFYIEDNKYFNKRQHLEYVKGLELSNTRSESRKKSKKKFDTVLSKQNTYKVDKDIDIDIDKETNSNILALEELWKSLSVKMRQRSSKPKSFLKFKALTEVNQGLVIQSYPIYVSLNGEYSVALERFIDNEKYLEVDSYEKTRNEEEDSKNIILKSKWEASKKYGKLLHNLTQNQFDEMQELYGEK